MAWKKLTWVDDDGSDTVGTPFSAGHMNNIEDGIDEANVTLVATQGIALAASGMALSASGGAVAASAAAIGASAGLIAEQAVRASGDLVRPGAIEHDMVTTTASGTGTLSWNHLPAATRPAAALVLIGQDYVGGSGDQIIGVSYGEQAMTKIGEAHLNAKGVAYAYLLTSSGKLKEGKQGVTISVKGAAKKRAICATFSAPHGEKIGYAFGSGTATGANMIPWIEAPVWLDRMMYALDMANKDPSGAGNGTYIQDELAEEVFGSASWANFARLRNPVVPGKEPEMLFSAAAGTVSVAIWTAIGVVKDWGEVTELPPAKSCLVGDTCHFVADAANNVVWDLVYDNRDSTYPWRKFGGAPIRSTATGGNVSGTGPSTAELTAPLACRLGVSFGCNFAQLLTASVVSQLTLQLLINGVENTSTAAVANAQFVGGPLKGENQTGTIEKGKKITLNWGANNGGTWGTSLAYVDLDPVRVG